MIEKNQQSVDLSPTVGDAARYAAMQAVLFSRDFAKPGLRPVPEVDQPWLELLCTNVGCSDVRAGSTRLCILLFAKVMLLELFALPAAVLSATIPRVHNPGRWRLVRFRDTRT